MITRKALFAGACAFQTSAVLFLALPPAMTLTEGRTITVITDPVDPRDMFRGDYIRLGYGFSQVPTRDKLDYNSNVFVHLKKDPKKGWKAVCAYKERPRVNADDVILLGQCEWTDRENMIRVKYGIEQVFVPEGKGRGIASADKIEVQLAVPNSGRAVIKRARLKDKLLYQWRWI